MIAAETRSFKSNKKNRPLHLCASAVKILMIAIIRMGMIVYPAVLEVQQMRGDDECNSREQ